MTVYADMLKNRVALITGASRGIGKAIATSFAKAGADLIITARKIEPLEKTAQDITSLTGRKIIPVSCHSGKLDQIEALAQRVKQEFDRVDILVNNAGVNPVFGPLLELEERAWDAVMNLNLKGFFLMTKVIGSMMVNARKGKIINISSSAGIRPNLGLGVYSISKAGIIMLTKALARELGPYNINVNAIAPGVVRTDMSKALFENQEFYHKEVLDPTPLGRVAETEDVVGAAIFLASDASNHITGLILSVDGGITI